MKIALFGPNGQVGTTLQQSLQSLGTVILCDRDRVDLCELDSLSSFLNRASPDIIVNAAAYTQVDQAESHPDDAHLINAKAPQKMAEYAARENALLIHYSTDYVFDGTHASPYLEDDVINPLNIYGSTKAEGEAAIREAHCRHLILRTSWVYSDHGKNFLKTILHLSRTKNQLKVVNDQKGAPTSARLIADVTATLIKHLSSSPAISGTFHLTAAGETTWHGFAQTIVEKAIAQGMKLALGPQDILPIPSTEYPTPAKRPQYSILNTKKLRDILHIEFPHWATAIDPILTSLIHKEMT